MASTYFCRSVKERFETFKAEVEEYGKSKILRSTLKGNVAILAMERLDDVEDKRFITIVFYSKMNANEVWEKVLDESVGPAFYDVPQVYLDLTECGGKGEMAELWRTEVKANNEFKKELKAFTIPTGAYIEIWGNKITYTGQGRIFEDDKGQLANATKKQFDEIKEKIMVKVKRGESIEAPEPTPEINEVEQTESSAKFKVVYDGTDFHVDLNKGSDGFKVVKVTVMGTELRLANLSRVSKKLEEAIMGLPSRCK